MKTKAGHTLTQILSGAALTEWERFLLNLVLEQQARLDDIAQLHYEETPPFDSPSERWVPYCATCGDSNAWPCATYRAITATEES